MHRKAVVSFALGLAAIAADLAHGQAPLTLPEAQRLAVERSRQLAAQDSAIAATRELAVAAGQLPDATARLQVQNLPVEGPDRWSLTRDFMTMSSIGVMQEWTRPEKRALRRERYEREADRAASEKDAVAATIARDTALAWLDRHYAEAMVDVAKEQLAAAQLEIVAADSAYRAGRVNQSDVLGAHSTRVGLEDRLSELERRVRNARTVLARWTGLPADAPLAGKPDIARIPYDFSKLEALVERHPGIAILERQQQVAAAEARLASAEAKVDPTFELMYARRGSAFGDMVSFGVSIPLQWNRGDRQQREIAAKLALAEAARAEREERERALLSDLATTAAEWHNGLERLARYEREVVPLARERTQAVLAAYQGGRAGTGELLLARRNEIDVRLQALQLELETARLWAALSYLAPGTIGASRGMEPSSPGPKAPAMTPSRM